MPRAKRCRASRDEGDGTGAEKIPPPQQQQQQQLSEERSCAEALMMACDERLGAQSPAALMVCDTFLARDLWTSFVHQSYLPPAASQVWAWGSNYNGQLGLGDKNDRTTPTEVTALHGRCIHAVACGGEHTMAVVDDGELWATGWNLFGRLGLGEEVQTVEVFTRVSGLSGRKVAAVACGFGHTLALLESGELFAWGRNDHGQLGLGDTTDKWSPEPVATLSGRRIAAIACGWNLTEAVLETGELFAWGRNNYGQLGLGDNEGHVLPTQVTTFTGRRVVAVVCGAAHTSAFLENGDLFMWGWNEHGQHGLGDCATSWCVPVLLEVFSSRPVNSVSFGGGHSLVLLKTGEVFACGWNDGGQLGLGFCSKESIRTLQQVHFFDGKRVKSIHCGISFSGAVQESGELFLWGDNRRGQLGTGDTVRKETPMLVTSLASKRVLSVALSYNYTIALIQ